MKLKLNITMRSDWHIGTGAGKHGGIDRLIARAADGLPYVPASTLRNVWRDAAEMLARGLDGQDGGEWARLVRRLFGSQPSSTERHAEDVPVPSLVTMSDAAIAPALQVRLQQGAAGAVWLRDALTYVKAGVAIDTDSGAALDDHLRFEEVAVGGILLVADAEVALDYEDTLYWFLCGAACLVERLGGKRRRGLGKCEVLLTCVEPRPERPSTLAELAVEAAKRLETASVPSIAPRRQETTAIESAQPVGAGADGGTIHWHRVPIAIKLDSPLIAPDGIQANVITTLHYIPGSMLLPAVASAARRSGLKDVSERIARSELRVLPATLDINGARGLPVPLAWGKPKDAPPPDADSIVSGILDKRTRERQVKPLRRGFIAPAGDHAVAFEEEPTTTLRTHNVIDDERQTPTEEIGGVFSYEAITAGQTFRSLVLLCGTAAEADALRAALAGGPQRIERLGRAKQVGYGRVSITAASEEPNIENRKRRALDGFLVVWLETDALLSSADLTAATTVDALADAIALALYLDGGKRGRELFVLAPEGSDADPDSRSQGFLRTRRLQTWQAQWGLPRPSLATVQAGSVIKLKLRDGVEITEEQWQTLEREGIGERRAEGFGVVRVNDVTVTTRQTLRKVERAANGQTVPTTPPPDPRKEEGILTPDEERLLTDITERAWKRRILACAEKAMSQAKQRKFHLGFAVDGTSPPMSQLGALRSRLPADGAADAGGVVVWIDAQSSKVEQRRQGHRATWLKEVRRIAREREAIWTVLDLPPDLPTPSDGAIENMRERLWAFAVTNTLLIAIRHHKRAGESMRTRKGETEPAVQGAAQ